MPDDDLGTALTLREWDEAWAHSRHLETSRAQYLGFFFTAVLAVTAFTTQKLSGSALFSSAALVTLVLLVLGLHLLAAFVYLAVLRINAVLHYYQRVIFAIRDGVALNYRPAIDLKEYSRPPTVPARDLRSRLRTTQGVSELVPLLGVTAFPLVMAGAVVRAFTLPHVTTATLILCVVGFVGALATCVLCRLATRKPSSEETGQAP